MDTDLEMYEKELAIAKADFAKAANPHDRKTCAETIQILERTIAEAKQTEANIELNRKKAEDAAYDAEEKRVLESERNASERKRGILDIIVKAAGVGVTLTLGVLTGLIMPTKTLKVADEQFEQSLKFEQEGVFRARTPRDKGINVSKSVDVRSRK